MAGIASSAEAHANPFLMLELLTYPCERDEIRYERENGEPEDGGLESRRRAGGDRAGKSRGGDQNYSRNN
jgi:hypothetical protein